METKNKSDEKEQTLNIGYVYITENNIMRKVENINETDKITNIINKLPDIKNNIIETEILPNNFLKHRKIKHIIHSGEYTQSMAYDVTKIALNMAITLLDWGIYSFDLLPHNYTFENGKWILFDFGSFSLNNSQIKTQIRSTFKISFAAFELLKIIHRKKLKHFFLNRISHKNLFLMIPFTNWLKWFLNCQFVLAFCKIKNYKKAFKSLLNILNSYENKKEIYYYIPNEIEKNIHNLINKISDKEEDIFCIGKFACDWALFSEKNIIKTLYLDNYELCDKYYNNICLNNLKNISIGVLQPLTKDEKIPENLKFRALYDEFTKSRMYSDCVLLDFNEVYDSTYYSINHFCKIISEYANNSLIIKIDFKYFKEINEYLSSVFYKVYIKKFEDFYIINFTNKIKNNKPKLIKYGNENRSKLAKEQSISILNIIKNNKKNNV